MQFHVAQGAFIIEIVEQTPTIRIRLHDREQAILLSETSLHLPAELRIQSLTSLLH